MTPEDEFEIAHPDDPVRALKWFLRRLPGAFSPFPRGSNDPPFDEELARFEAFTLPDEHGTIVVVTPPQRAGLPVPEPDFRDVLYRNVVPFYMRFEEGRWTVIRPLGPRPGSGTIDDFLIDEDGP